MADPFVGEIRMFAGSYAPYQWAFCDGQLMAISQNDTLFTLFGTIYGGDGVTTFGLPDLRGRIPIHQGAGPGLTTRVLGSKSGSERQVLTVNQIPSHTHTAQASNNEAVATTINNNVLAKIRVEDDDKFYTAPTGTQDPLITGVVGSSGGSQSHSNLMPTLCVNFIVSLYGYYPSRN